MAANLGASAKVKRSHAKGKRTITTQSVKKAYLNKIYSLSKYQDDGYFLTDITGDGRVDIADVNAVINAMLGK